MGTMMKRLLRRLRVMFWRAVPHRCHGPLIATKYGVSATCARCGRGEVYMDDCTFAGD